MINRDTFLNVFEFIGMGILNLMAWFWSDKEFDDTANEAIGNILK